MNGDLPRMTYPQYRRMRRLVHECCNYDAGNCLALENGDACICPQSISYSLICRWFRAAVLPLDRELHAILLYKGRVKSCAVCGRQFLPGSNRAKYCPECAAKVHRRQKTQSDQRRRGAVRTIRPFEPIGTQGFLDTSQQGG